MLDKEDKNNFYVYLHRKKKNDEIFYVGKGIGVRYKKSAGRSSYWSDVALNNEWYATIIKDNLSEEDALELESIIIRTIGLENLCNQNYFKGGKYGYVCSLSTRQRMSESKKGHTPWNKGVKCEYSSLKMKGKNNPMYGKKRVHSKEVLSKLRKTNGTLVCDLHTGIFYDSITEMSETLGIGRKTVELRKRIHL